MAHRQLFFRAAAREKVLRGATALADAVRGLAVVVCICLTAYLLGGTFVARTSVAMTQEHAEAPGPWEVVFFEHADFVGQYVKFGIEPGMRQKLVNRLPDEWDNRITSVWAGTNVYAELFEGPDYAGEVAPGLIFSRDLKHANLDDQVTSIIIYPRAMEDPAGVGLQNTCWPVFPHFLNRFYPLPEKEADTEVGYPALYDFEGGVNGIDISIPNVEVTLYDGKNFQGASVTFPGPKGGDPPYYHVRLDKYGWSDRAASMIVRWKGPLLELGPKPHPVKKGED